MTAKEIEPKVKKPEIHLSEEAMKRAEAVREIRKFVQRKLLS